MKCNKMYQYVIVGGGISGLYAAYKLVKRHGDGVKITIFEKGNRLGGRVHSVLRDGVYLEAGAGRINESHKRVLKLIRELGLENDLIQIGGKKVYLRNGKEYNAETLFDKMVAQMKKFDKKELRSQTLLMLARQCMSASEVDEIIYYFGYNSEFEVMNAYDALRSFEKGEKYYKMKNGTSSIIRALEKCLKKCHGVSMFLEHEVLGIDADKKIYYTNRGIHGEIAFDKALICLDKAGYDGLRSGLHGNLRVIGMPFCRIYARFPMNSDGRVWFHGMKRISTNSPLRQIIPVNVDKGIAMISYSDSTWAFNWGNMPNGQMKKEVMRCLRSLFGDIPEPLWIQRFYWEHGVHFPMVDYHELKQKKEDDIIICGEASVNESNGWMEGALLSVDNYI